MAVDNVELEMFTFHCLRELQKKGTLCDLVLISSDWQEFKVHSLVVVAVSKSFYNLFIEQGSLKKLRLMNVQGDSLRLLIRFLYGENLSNIDDLKHLSQTLKKLGMKDLFQFIGTSLCHFGMPSTDISSGTNKNELLKESKEGIHEEQNCVVSHSNRPGETRGDNSENVNSGKEESTLTVMNNGGSLKPLGLYVNESNLLKKNQPNQQTEEITSTKETSKEQVQDNTDTTSAIKPRSVVQNDGDTVDESTSKNEQAMFYFDKKYALVFAKKTNSNDHDKNVVKIQLPYKTPHEEQSATKSITNISPTNKSLNQTNVKMTPIEKAVPLHQTFQLSKTKKVISVKTVKTSQELLSVSNCLSGLPVSHSKKQNTDQTDERKGNKTNSQISGENQIKELQPKTETDKLTTSSDLTQFKGLCKPAFVSLTRIPEVKPGQRFKVPNNGSIKRSDEKYDESAPVSRKRTSGIADQEPQTKFPREDDVNEEEMLIIDLKQERAPSPDVTLTRPTLMNKGTAVTHSNENRSTWRSDKVQEGTAKAKAAQPSYEKILTNIKTEPKSLDDSNFTHDHVESQHSPRQQGAPDIGHERIKTEIEVENTESSDHAHEHMFLHDKVSLPQSHCEEMPKRQTRSSSRRNSSTMPTSTVTNKMSSSTPVKSTTRDPSRNTCPIMIQLPDGNVTTVMFPQNLINTNPADQKKHRSSRIHQNVADVTSPLQFDEFDSKRALPVQIQLPNGKSTTVMVPKQLTEVIPHVSSLYKPIQPGPFQIPLMRQEVPVPSIPSKPPTSNEIGTQTIIYHKTRTNVPVASPVQLSSNVSSKLSKSAAISSTRVPEKTLPKMIFQNSTPMLSQIQITKPALGDISGNVSTSTVVGSPSVPHNSSPKRIFQTSTFPVVSTDKIRDPTAVTENLSNKIILLQPQTSSPTQSVSNCLQTVASGGQIDQMKLSKIQSSGQVSIQHLHSVPQFPIANQAQVMQPQFPAFLQGQQMFLQQNQPVASPAALVNSPRVLGQQTFLQVPQPLQVIQTKASVPGLGPTVHLPKDFVLSSGQSGPPHPVQIFNNTCVSQAGPVRFPVVGFKSTIPIIGTNQSISVSSQSVLAKPDEKLKSKVDTMYR